MPHRFIPTRVGNTVDRAAQRPCHNAVHPHASGEHAPPEYSSTLSTVHPHASGEHRHGVKLSDVAIRFIPTRVGNTSRAQPCAGVFAVHPHASGEHVRRDWISSSIATVHPHASGEHTGSATLRHGDRRFIPTRVGNTQSAYRSAVNRPVHPHASGEHAAVLRERGLLASRFIPTRVGNTTARLYWPLRIDGSSPREWGTLACCDVADYIWSRFIPTRVGNTTQTGQRVPNVRGSSPREWGTRQCPMDYGGSPAVHPHASGEHASQAAVPDGNTRFIPTRVGNTLASAIRRAVRSRFIPTRVGNTDCATASVRQLAVHPHASGEHANAQPVSSSAGSVHPHASGEHGSSRGKLHQTRPVHPHASGEHRRDESDRHA